MAKIIGKEIVEVSSIHTLTNVLYMLRLKHNLISISQICNKSYAKHFVKDGCEIKAKEGNVIVKGLRKTTIVM